MPVRSDGWNGIWIGSAVPTTRKTMTSEGASKSAAFRPHLGLEAQPRLPCNQATACPPRTQACRPSQEPARPARQPDCGGGQRYSYREDFVPRLAEALWQERGPACPGDADRSPETHSCKHWRHPARVPHAHHQTVAVLPRLPHLYQKAALAALAPLRLRHRPRAARPVLCVPGGSSLDPATTIPSIAHDEWEGAEARLRAAMERLHQRAKEGQVLPRSVGIPRAGARLPQSFAKSQQELVYRRGRREALAMQQEPPALEPGESQSPTPKRYDSKKKNAV